ncbi:MAG: leucine-rich repeat protein [Prevotella sp.]|nr:leucine-rich repeat protein [Prevotella sp.]
MKKLFLFFIMTVFVSVGAKAEVTLSHQWPGNDCILTIKTTAANDIANMSDGDLNSLVSTYLTNIYYNTYGYGEVRIVIDGPVNKYDIQKLVVLRNNTFTNGSGVECVKNANSFNLEKAQFKDASNGDIDYKALFNSIDSPLGNFEYIALPPQVDDDGNILPIDDSVFNKINPGTNEPYLKHFKSVVAFDTDNHYNLKKLTAYVKEEGSLLGAMRAAAALTNETSLVREKAENIKEAYISGNVNAVDLGNGGSGTLTIGENGHLEFLEDVDETNANQTRTLKGTSTDVALGFIALEKLDLSKANFSDINDLTLSALGGTVSSSTKQVIIPESVNTLPADFLNGCGNITDLCIPSNIEYIKTRAFKGTRLNHVWTTAYTGDAPDTKYDNGKHDGSGNEFFGYDSPNWHDSSDSSYGSITLSSNLKLIESYAFESSTNVKDVYVLATDAPECHVDAFNSMMYCANNTLVNDKITNGYIERDAYQKDDTQGLWCAVLHFPENTVTPSIQRYTDVTRDYSIPSNMTDAKGNTIMFPTQQEFLRAYGQGTTGYLWNAWDPQRQGRDLSPGNPNAFVDNGAVNTYPVPQKDANTLYNNNAEETDRYDKTLTTFYDVTKEANGTTATVQATTPSAPVNYTEVKWDESTYTLNTTTGDQLYDADYRGWHQFVLTAYTNFSNNPPNTWKFTQSDNDWWTICLPFDMTKRELREFFGDESKGDAANAFPVLSKLVKVYRQEDDRPKENTITLVFGPDLLQNKEVVESGEVHGTVSEGVAPDLDDVVLHQGVPYMIRPRRAGNGSTLWRAQKDTPAGQKIAAKSGAQWNEMLLKGLYTVNSYKKDETLRSDFTYTFVGSFYKYYLPKYSYYLGFNNEENKVCFYWQSEEAYNANHNYSWNTFTGIICPNWDSRTKKSGGDFYEATNFDEGMHWNVEGFPDDTQGFNPVYPNNEFPGHPVSAKMMFMFEDSYNDATGVSEVIGKASVPASMKIYNLNGVYVGDSFRGLSKGVYVVNGKKYVVK